MLYHFIKILTKTVWFSIVVAGLGACSEIDKPNLTKAISIETESDSLTFFLSKPQVLEEKQKDSVRIQKQEKAKKRKNKLKEHEFYLGPVPE
jgi:hypothetical protein